MVVHPSSDIVRISNKKPRVKHYFTLAFSVSVTSNQDVENPSFNLCLQ